MNEKNLFSGHYENWRNRRVQFIINYYGKDFFKGKKLLEIGCGHGDIGYAFHCLGADVLCLDARQEHLNFLKQQYPELKSIHIDLDRDWQIDEKFDIVIDMGVLYHLKEYKKHLERISKITDYLCLESEVCDSSNPNFVIYTEEQGYDQAFNGIGCRPSAPNIENILEEYGFVYIRCDDWRINSTFHSYDWKVKNTNNWHHGMRRFWIARKSDQGELLHYPPENTWNKIQKQARVTFHAIRSFW